MKKISIILIAFLLFGLSSCKLGAPSPATEFYFDTFAELDMFLNSIPILEPDLSEDQIIEKYTGYNEKNRKILAYYRHYVYADLIDAHERVIDVNYKLIIHDDGVKPQDIKGMQTLKFIYKIDDEHLKGIVLTIEPVSEKRIDFENYEFIEMDSSNITRIHRDRAAKGYPPKAFVENLGIDSYVENRKIIRPTYEIRYAKNETVFAKQNIRISFFYNIDYIRTSNDLDFEAVIINYVKQNMSIYIFE